MNPGRSTELLESQIIELSELRNAHARDPRFKQWRQATLTVIQRLWPGDVARAERFRRVPFSPPSTRMSAKAARTFYEKGCAEAQQLLRVMMSDLKDSPAIGLPTRRDPVLDPGAAEDDFPLVELGGAKQDAPEEDDGLRAPTIDLPRTPERPARPAPVARPTPGALPASDAARPAAREPRPAQRPAAPAPAAPEPPRPVAREPKRPAVPPIVVRGTPPPDDDAQRPSVSTRIDRPARPADPRPPLREMLGFSATPLDDEEPAEVFAAEEEAADEDAGTYEPLAAMEPESESYDIDEEEAEVGEEPEAGEEAEPEPEPEPEYDRAEMEAFLKSSPVLKASARPVVRQRPAAAPAALQSPLAKAVAALAAEVERLGVPEGHRAAVRAMLLDLARGLDRQEVEWTTLSESMRLALAYPALARRVIPLLVPFLDIAS
jgi:hypothetical protein